MNEAARLTGVNTVLVTPFHEDESIDVDSLHRVVNTAVEAGVDGVVALAIMGEVHKLSDVERTVVIEAVVEACDDRVPVTVGCSAEATTVAVERVDAAQRLGADAVMVAPPRGSRPDQLPAHYRAVAAATDLPVVVQDEPVKTGVVFPAPVIARCLELPNVSYVKVEEVPTPDKVSAIIEAAPGATCFGGLGGVYLYEELERGADGTMTGFAFPQILVEVFRRHRSGDVDGAREHFYRYLPLIRFEAQLGVGGVANRKQILAERGVISSSRARDPADAVDPRTLDELRALIDHLGVS